MEFPRLHQKSYEAIPNTNPGSTKHDRPKIVKNLAALCAGTLMLFTAYDALTMLQSTMNRQGGIGVISQATLYAFFCVSAILLPKFFISKFGSKNTSVAAMFAYLPYIASNYYPHWSLMIPSSILLGIAGPLLWASHGVYLNGLAVLYSSRGVPVVEEGVCYSATKKNARKKSCDGMDKQNSIVPNAIGDRVGLEHGESKMAPSLQSRKRLDYRDTSLTRSLSSDVVTDELKDASILQSRARLNSTIMDYSMARSHTSNVVTDELKCGESKEASILQSRERLDHTMIDTSTARSHTSNVVTDELKYGESKEASILQFCKRLDYTIIDTSMTRSHTSYVVTNELKSGKNEETSSLQHRRTPDSMNTSVTRSQTSNAVLDKMKYGETEETLSLQHRRTPDSTNTSVTQSQTSNAALDKMKYGETKEAESLQPRKRLECGEICLTRSQSSNMISETARSSQPHNNAVGPSYPECHDSRTHRNSFEGNYKGDETKRLVAKATSSLLSSTTAKFFGFHGMAHLTSHVWSSLLSYFTLKTDDVFVDFGNSSCRCGAEFCSVVSECFEYNAGVPGTNVRTVLTSICVCLCLISILIVWVFLDALEQEKRVVYFSFDFLNATCSILKRREMLLLIPLSIHTGLVQGFYVGDFNKSYVACAWGTYHVGLVAVCYGVACGASSLLSGWCVRHCGRRPAFTSAAVVNGVSILFLLLWSPDPKRPEMFFFASAMWGIHVGIVWSQLRAFYGVLFPSDEEAAFSAFHLWSGLGFCAAFASSSFFCIYHKLFVITAASVLGFSGYYAVELIYCKKNKDSY